MRVLCLLGFLLSISLEVEGYKNQEFPWGYEKSNGPDVWGDYFPQCNGYKQSGIVLPTVPTDDYILKRIEYHDAEQFHESELINDGKAIHHRIIDSRKGPSISGSLFGANERYLLDFGILRIGRQDPYGSEHGMNGKQYPAEKQDFWYNSKFASLEDALKVPGNVAVTSQLLEISGKDNPGLDGLVSSFSYVNGTTKPHRYSENYFVHSPVFKKNSIGNKICVNCDYYFYRGSLAYPPCTEGVLWHVYMDTLKISESQINVLRSVVSPETGKPIVNNDRNPQPVNFRDILQHRENAPKEYLPQLSAPSKLYAPQLSSYHFPQPYVPQPHMLQHNPNYPIGLPYTPPYPIGLPYTPTHYNL